MYQRRLFLSQHMTDLAYSAMNVYERLFNKHCVNGLWLSPSYRGVLEVSLLGMSCPAHMHVGRTVGVALPGSPSLYLQILHTPSMRSTNYTKVAN